MDLQPELSTVLAAAANTVRQASFRPYVLHIEKGLMVVRRSQSTHIAEASNSMRPRGTAGQSNTLV